MKLRNFLFLARDEVNEWEIISETPAPKKSKKIPILKLRRKES